MEEEPSKTKDYRRLDRAGRDLSEDLSYVVLAHPLRSQDLGHKLQFPVCPALRALPYLLLLSQSLAVGCRRLGRVDISAQVRRCWPEERDSPDKSFPLKSWERAP